MTRVKVPRLLRGVGIAFAAGALTVSMATPGAANQISSNLERPDDGSGIAAVLSALERDLGVDAAEAAELVETHAAAFALAEQLENELGNSYAGAWFDAETGALQVATTDAAAARQATSAGADVQVVDRSLRQLQAIEAQVTAMVKADPENLTEVTAWRIDAASNQVVVTVKEGHAAIVDDLVTAHGDAITVVESTFTPSLTNHGGEPFLDGGIEYASGGGLCSTGINGFNGTSSFVYTAAHCGAIGTPTSHSGTGIGQFVARDAAFDDAIMQVTNPFWVVGPWIWTYSGGGFVTVVNIADALVGAPVCKSGRTTAITCGTVTGVGETVNFGGLIVQNLTRHDACVEPGDSGGSNYGPPNSAGVFALGTSTGAQLVGGQLCLERFGQPNVSWYAPIVPAVAFYGVPVLVG